MTYWTNQSFYRLNQGSKSFNRNRNQLIWLLENVTFNEIHIVSTVNKLLLQNSLTKSSWWMSKNKFPFFSKSLFLRRITSETLGRNWRNFFYRNIFDISQSQHRVVRVSRGSIKKPFLIKLFEFCELKTQHRYIPQEEVNIFTSELSFVVNSFSAFLKPFDKASKCL